MGQYLDYWVADLMGKSTSCTVGHRTDETVLVLLDVGLLGQYLDYWVADCWNRALVVLLDVGLMGQYLYYWT